MNARISFSFLMIIASLTFFVFAVQAHKLNVFAYENGGDVIAEVRFDSGRAARGTTVTVEKDSGEVLLSKTTDENGEVRFTLPPEVTGNRDDLTVVADTGDGHRGSWRLRAEDFPAGESTQPSPARSVSAERHEAASAMSGTSREDCQMIEQIVAKAVEKELAPVKKMLARQSARRVSLQDILGGMGYIFGLAGIAAYFRSKRQEEKQ